MNQSNQPANSVGVMAVQASGDQRRSSRISPEHMTAGLLLVLTVLMIILSRFISASLGSWSQIMTVITLGSFLLVVAFGQGLVVMTGGLDLSVASLFMFGGVMSAALIGGSDIQVWFRMPAIILAAGAIGALSGVGVAVFRIPPFIMTMGTGIIIASAALGYTSGSTLGASPTFLVHLMTGSLAGIPLIVMVFAFVAVAGILFQSRTVFGRNLYAVGGSLGAAHVAGVPVLVTTVLAYGASAMCAAIGGALLTGYSSGATLMMGDPYLLPSIAAVVVGGSSITGGRGSFFGTIVGTLFLTTLDSVIAATGMGQGWRLIVSGGVIVVAVLIQASSGRPMPAWFVALTRRHAK